MRFLIDNSVSWRVGRHMREVGHDVVHVADIGLDRADDPVIYKRAVEENRIVLTQDSDFGPVHASANTRVGVILMRLSDGRPSHQAELLISNLEALDTSLAASSFVVIEDDRITIRDPGESSSD